MSSFANRGLGAEAVIILSNEYYRREGIAVVEKQPTEWLPLRNSYGKVCSAKVTHRASVDFLGIWKGHPIALDVKSCSQPRWPLSSVKEHQYEFLRDWHACGGISFILLCHEVAGWRLLTLAGYGAAVRSGVKSLNVEDMRALPLCGGAPGCALDYLAGFGQLVER